MRLRLFGQGFESLQIITESLPKFRIFVDELEGTSLDLYGALVISTGREDHRILAEHERIHGSAAHGSTPEGECTVRLAGPCEKLRGQKQFERRGG
jgi:hypothetical protein